MADSSGVALPWLLVSDVDDTLTGDDDALARLADVLSEKRHRVVLALNSSRPWVSVEMTMRAVFPPHLPIAASITAMGTEIRVGGAPLDSWTDRFAGWPRPAIFDLVTGLGYRPHEEQFQTPAKASFAVPRGPDQARVRAALETEGLPFQAIASGMDDFDLLPPGAGKGTATRHLAAALGVPMDRVVAAGDSANDLALFEAAAHAIAVGNARPELLDAMPAAKCYHARQNHAAGILEGLRHFNILDRVV